MASIVCALLAIEMRISVGVNLGTPAMNIIDTMGIGFAMRMQIDVGTYTRDEIRRALAHREPEDGAQRLLRWWKPRLRRRLQTREAGQDPNRKQLLAAPDGRSGANGPRRLVVDAAGRFAYVTNTICHGAGPGKVSAFNVGRMPLLLHPNGKLLLTRSSIACRPY